MITCSNLNRIRGIKHGFFTRKNGVSEGIYESLNCGPGSNDDPEKVKQNRSAVLKELGVKSEELCTLYQCHSSDVVVLNDSSEHVPQTKADALVTQASGFTIGILTADCAPVLFASTDGKTIGAAHAGWKGAIGGVLENTVADMYDLGVNHSDIVATIGPCIGAESYEVGAEFRENFLDEDDSSYQFFKMIDKKDHFLFNLPGYVNHRLSQLGLHKVTWTGQDTLTNEEDFFSYRRATIRKEPDYGRQVSVISIV